MQKSSLIFQSMGCLSEDELRLYLSGKLDASSRFRVENHLLDCPLCSEAIEGFARKYDFDKDSGLEELKKAVNEKSKKYGEGGREGRTFSFNSIAAAILFLIVSGATLMYWKAQQNESTFLSEFQSGTIENMRGVDDFPIDNQLKEGVDDFRSGDYTESILFFENLQESGFEDPAINYFLGLSALKKGEFEKAIDNLSIARVNGEDYYEEATWHLILANLSIDNKAETKALIKDLLKIEGGFYNEKAEKLFRKLE